MFNLQNKNAVVTGAGLGMGHAMTVRFAKEGAQVVVAEIDEGSAKDTFDEIGGRGLLSIPASWLLIPRRTTRSISNKR